jgi:hypothetical protein
MTARWVSVSNLDVDADSGQVVVGATVNGDLVQNMATFVRGRPPMYLSTAEVSDRLACYVPAHNHDLVVKEFRLNHAVGIVGPPGGGRETTAIAAMHQLRPAIPIRRFSLEDEDSEEIDAARAHGYIIHALDRGLARLGRCIEAVRTSGGYLVVVAEHVVPQSAAEFLSWITVESPDPVRVYRRWVGRRGLAEWANWEQARILLKGALPIDARRLADLAAEANRRGGDIMARQTEAAQAYSGWAEELQGWFSDHPEPHERALLVAAATLPMGATEAYIYAAASSLAQRLQIDINGGGLAWCPVTGLPTLLRAGQEGGQVAFHRMGYAESALRHTFADYPLARPDLLAWLADLPTGHAATCGMEDKVAQTFADLAAEHGEDEYIIRAGRTWGRNDLADLAFIVLSRTCLDPRVGVPVRRALYDWSRTANTPQTLKLVIARVCQLLGQTYTSVALTRLKHLATYSDKQVAGEVITAARTLASEGHFEEVLAASLCWCAQDSHESLTDRARQRRRKVGAMLFLDLAKPAASSGLPEVLDRGGAADPASCVPGWRAVLDFHATPGLWKGAIEQVLIRWLDASLRHDHIRARISAILISATSPPVSFDRGSRAKTPKRNHAIAELVIDIVRRWAATDITDAMRVEIRDQIIIPLTRPWWLRLAKIIYAMLRTHVPALTQNHSTGDARLTDRDR